MAAPPPSKPDRRISRTKCDAPHLMRYVVNWVMWCRGGITFDSLGLSPFQHHIIFFK